MLVNFTFSFFICGQAGSPYSRDLARICHIEVEFLAVPCSPWCHSVLQNRLAWWHVTVHTPTPRHPRGKELKPMLKRPGAIFILDDKRRKVRRWLQSNAAPAVSVVQSSGVSGETSASRGAAEIRQRTEGGGAQGGSLTSPPFGSLTLCFLLPPPCVEK